MASRARTVADTSAASASANASASKRRHWSVRRPVREPASRKTHKTLGFLAKLNVVAGCRPQAGPEVRPSKAAARRPLEPRPSIMMMMMTSIVTADGASAAAAADAAAADMFELSLGKVGENRQTFTGRSSLLLLLLPLVSSVSLTNGSLFQPASVALKLFGRTVARTERRRATYLWHSNYNSRQRGSDFSLSSRRRRQSSVRTSWTRLVVRAGQTDESGHILLPTLARVLFFARRVKWASKRQWHFSGCARATSPTRSGFQYFAALATS